MRRAPLSGRLRPRVHDPLQFDSVFCDCGEEFAWERSRPLAHCPTCKLIHSFAEASKKDAP